MALMDGVVANVTRDLLVDSALLSEPATISAIYSHYFARVYTYVHYRVADAATADDLTAQIFERMVSRIATYNSLRGPFAVWLWAIARNSVTDHLRANQRHRWLTLDGVREWLSPTPLPEDTVIQAELHNALLHAVSGLADRERDLIALKFVGHFTNRRIAALTGLSESNVAVILHRTLKRLRVELAPEVNDE